MMQAFRNAAKPVVILITVTFMLWMVLDLSGLSGSSGLFTKTDVGSINGRGVDLRAYEQMVQNAVSERQRELGRGLGIEETQQLRDQVWESIIQRNIIEAEVDRRNISVTSEEIAQVMQMVPLPEIQSDPTFQTEGRFDLSKYRAWLTSAVGQQYVPFLETQYREELLRSKLLRNVTADVFLSDPALWERYRDQNETASIALTPLVPNRVIPDDSVVVSPADVDAYYRDHRSEFDRAETAFLSYIAVNRSLDASDSAAALDRARRLRTEILDGAPFAEIAQRESSDQASASRGGELGTFGRGAMVAAFDDAAFRMPLNTLSEPLLTEFGYHLIEVTGRTADSVTARHVLIPIELAGAHRDMIDAQADSLEELAADRLDPAALDTAARALRLPIGQTAPIQRGNQAVVGPYLLGDPATWAFQAEVGETSPVVETEDALFVFRLDSLHKAGIPPLEQIRDAVANAVIEQRKEELALAKANELVRRVKGGESLAAASAAMGLQHREFPAFTRIQPPLPNPQLIGASFGLPVGALSAPIVTNEGIYVIRVLARTQADSAQFRSGYDQFQAREIRSARDERVRFFLSALRDEAKIKDRRAEVFRTSAQIEATTPGLQ
ncbi:MAG TPA: peptidyl-prolyl cis-trans isomerase [Gemmatimonadales bacterium]|nr:peptidyl-prolyl cis-trans isomerase [Gemmatimonadales bacterium]